MGIKTYKKTANKKLSKNFKLSELVCHGVGCCSTAQIDDQLVVYLQKIRDHFGKPVTVTSAYRCSTWNKAVGGVSGSRHRYGMAADIKVKDTAPATVAKYAETIGIKGVGLYETAKDGYFVHIDTRDVKSFWYGQKQTYRSTFGGYSPEEFTRDVQRSCGAKVDGIPGKETLGKTPTLSRKENPRHPVVIHVQKRLNALGFACGLVDGIFGARTESAVKAHRKSIGGLNVGTLVGGKNQWKNLLNMK